MHLIDTVAKSCDIHILSDMRMCDDWYWEVNQLLNNEEKSYSLKEWNQLFEYINVKPVDLVLKNYKDIKDSLEEFKEKHDLNLREIKKQMKVNQFEH